MKTWKYSGRPGYDLHDALEFCCANVLPMTYMEVGVDGGGSLKTVMESKHRPKAVVLFDMWTGHAGHTFKDFGHIRKLMASYPNTSVRTHEGDSRVTIPAYANTGATKVFDLINIDGGHEYDVALADLTNAWPMLRIGGALVLDDVGHKSYPGVKRAFDEFMTATCDAQIIPEEGGVLRNCVILIKL